MPKIQHVSLEAYQQGKFIAADVAIRIVDDALLFGRDYPGMLTHHFVFADANEDDEQAISSQQANELVHILQSAFAQQQDVLVHCVAGVSRSGAVAQFAIDYLGFSDGNSSTDWRLPNAAVLKALKTALLGEECPFFQ